MRPAFVLTVLALTSASPAYASAEGATGGVAVPPAATGGMPAPGETDYGATVNGGALPPGGARPADPAGGPVGPLRSGPPASGSAAAARPAQDGQPDVPPTEAEPDDDDVEVQVPIDGQARKPAATPSAPAGTPFGGLAPTGLAVAALAALGAAVVAAGLGLRRLAG